MKNHTEQKIKYLLMSKDKANIKIAFQILHNQPASPTYKTWLFALSYYHPEPDIREEAKVLLQVLVHEAFLTYLATLTNNVGMIALKHEYRYNYHSELQAQGVLNKVAAYDCLPVEELANLTLYWTQTGFLFFHQQQLNIWKKCCLEVQQLDLRHVFTIEMAPLLAKFSQLQSLDISANHLDSIPSEIAGLHQLTEFYAYQNRLSEVNIIAQFRHLKKADISDNLIEYLPENIHQLKLLKSLKVSGNYLQILPKGIFELTQLTELDCCNNCLEDISENIQHLSQLKELDFYANNLRSLPASISSLPQLQNVYLGHNYINLISIFCPTSGNLQTKYHSNRSSGSWGVELLSLNEACSINSFDYQEVTGEQYWQDATAMNLVQAENLLHEFYQEVAPKGLSEYHSLLLNDELTPQDASSWLEHLLIASFVSYSNNESTYDNEVNTSSHALRVDASLSPALYTTDPFLEMAVLAQSFGENDALTIDANLLEITQLLNQQIHYFDQTLLLHCIEDDIDDFLYDQVKVDAHIWEIMKEEGMQVGYLVEGELNDY